ncbi:MAG: hypothetical protein PWP37_576 [Thermotogota bacterium]|nr:hypothetical protein [Thermotogota bacterium]MDK2864384.1 hypothetical protein [Thermotogota bacterium]HCZ05905.1 hypothetical protein [Thermotogota bacterium]
MIPDIEKLIEGVDVEAVYFVDEEIPTYVVVTSNDSEVIARLKKGFVDPEVDVNVVVLTPQEYEKLGELNPSLNEMLEYGERLK